jgi:hypothetical protein
LIVNALPVVTFNQPQTNFCVNQPAVPLNGQPSGGSYSGLGSGAGNFNPASAGLGSHQINYVYSDANNCSNSAKTTLNVAACTSLNEMQITTSFAVYPIPASNQITIKANKALKDTRLNIFNSLGQFIQSVEFKEGMETISINTHLFARGIYLLRADEQSEIGVVKFVLE